MLGQMKAWIKSSPFGLAAILLATTIVGGSLIALKLQLSTVGTNPDENHFAEALSVIIVFSEIAALSSLASLLGLGFSLASLVMGEGKRIPGIVGIILNGTIFVLARIIVHAVFAK
jgi:hypothetical protein